MGSNNCSVTMTGNSRKLKLKPVTTLMANYEDGNDSCTYIQICFLSRWCIWHSQISVKNQMKGDIGMAN